MGSTDFSMVAQLTVNDLTHRRVRTEAGTILGEVAPCCELPSSEYDGQIPCHLSGTRKTVCYLGQLGFGSLPAQSVEEVDLEEMQEVRRQIATRLPVEFPQFSPSKQAKVKELLELEAPDLLELIRS